ncbi:MAG: hypothetical protein HC905_25095 [Bacteroidales bacterium]|nr:hypothetical protein [Bacteroidales bacterium]
MPLGICHDNQGNIYVSETLNPKIRIITPDGIVKTIAGTGVNGFLDGSGENAMFYTPSALCMAKDGTNNIYISEFGNNRIRKLSYE